MCWNCRGLFSSISCLSDLLAEYKVNICAISEHWLRTYQLHVLNTIDNNFVSISKGVDIHNPESMSCNSRCGVAFLVSKDIVSFVTEIDIDSDRIIGIQVNLPNVQTFIILSIYLPATTQPHQLYQYNVELLHEICSVYKDMGSIILMGDFNTKIQGPRYKFNPDERSRLMYSLIQEYELFSVNTQMFCHGPVTTFQSYDNGPSTCIDHILMPLSEIGKVSNAKVIDSQPFSVSDHRPILCSITIENSVLTHTEGEQSTRSVSWDRARKFGYINDYSFALSQHLWTSEFPRHEINKLIIEDYYDKIVSAIKQAEQETLPYSIFKPYQKPYWNKSLTHLRDMMRLNRIEWLNNCNCHDLKCDAFNHYKQAKRAFRDAQRSAIDEYESAIAQKIENDIDVDQKSVWIILNKRKQKPHTCTALKKDGTLFTDSNDLMSIWYDHFQNVFSQSVYSEPDRETYISDRVSTIREINRTLNEKDDLQFSYSDVINICSHLKNNKACGHDRIAYEHIKYGGKLLLRHLHHLFNMVIQCGYIPGEWRKSIIFLLFKGGKKPRTDTNSYRGISLVPSIAKIFEKLLENELTKLRPDFPNHQQVAYQKQLSSMNASYNLQEVKFHHIEKGGPVKIVLLDSTKAFDTVPHDGLRIKLYEYGLPAKLWCLLDNMYSDLTSAVFSGGKLSNWFKLHRGVRQGSVLSAKLYLIFINDLIDKLESSQQGAFIHDLNASTPVQADDISIIATDRQSSQVMVKICEEYSIRWSFAFSAGKSQLLHFGKPTTGTDVLLYNEPISTVKIAKHCGINLYTCLKSMDRTIDVCRTLRATVISLIRLGVHPAILNPIVCSKFVKQVCYPKALYGCELWGKLTSTEWLMLERTQHYICKNIQGLPRRTRSDMCLPMIGWFSIESYVDEKKLLFLGRICNLPCESVSFRILIRRVNDFKYNDGSHSNLGFTVDIINILRKYELSTYFNDFCETGLFPTPLIWKRIVKTTVAAFEIVNWTRRINIDDDFVAFKMIKKEYAPHPAWTIALKHPNLRKQAQYLTSVCCLVRDNDNGQYILCDRCGKMFLDPLVHAIASCDYLDETRDNFWCEIININPITFSIFLANMSDEELFYYLLSCNSDNFPLETDQLETFQAICVRYIHKFGTLLQD
ncbi:unnamed protein product [Mytilus edulis]|uniref:Reverse transcriptase domain-containing protein n=1 Tax=Mytilus edulis TaxID=6550 RepID=A0A8S3QBJ6_MYTED|nr:unnamed protein product [Mytilus edulis]